jgi:hypothetical protein
MIHQQRALSPNNIQKINQGSIYRSYDADQHVIDVDKKGLKQRDEPFDLVLENTAARVLPDKPAYKDLPLRDELPCDMPPKQSSHAMASERPCTQLLQAVQGSPDQSPPPHPVSVTVQ